MHTVTPLSLALLLPFLLCAVYPAKAQVKVDTARVYKIDEVVVKENRKMKELRSTTPLQVLDAGRLRESGSLQVSDAAKLFSGVVVKDYGGIGGLKTISIRSLGAAHTAVAYDGITLTDAQTGQIDLGKLSLDNVEAVSLTSGQSDNILQPARLFSSAGVLHIHTLRPRFTTRNMHTNVSLKAGSFGFVNPNLRIENRWNKHFASSASLDYVHIHGAYPYTLINGDATEKRHRENSDVQSIKAEANIYGTFGEHRKANLKAYYYQSERGLPTNILYNTYAGQRLWDKNFFIQTSYENRLGNRWSLLANAKYNHSYNRYNDPSVLNIAGCEDNHYRQDEYYLSATVLFRPLSRLSFSLANDGSINHMRADLADFAVPTRYTLLNVLAAKYVSERFTATAHLLSTLTKETVKQGTPASDRQRLSPSVSLSVQPFRQEDLRLRLLYKDIFRLPTFNDLYYGTVGTRTLRPEKAKELNAGITWVKQTNGVLASISVSADAFYNRITDKIVAMPSKNLFVWSMLNVGQVDIKGTEVNCQTDLRLSHAVALQINGNYTWQRALDKTDKHRLPYKTTYNHQIPYTPRHSGSVRLTLHMPWINLGYTVIVSGERYCNQYNSTEYRLEGYREHSISAFRSFPIGKCKLTVQAEALNFTDQQYEVVKNYPMPGKQFRGMVSLSY